MSGENPQGRWKIVVERSYYTDGSNGPLRRWMATVYEWTITEDSPEGVWYIRPGNRWDNHAGLSTLAFTKKGAERKGRRAIARLEVRRVQSPYDPQRSTIYVP